MKAFGQHRRMTGDSPAVIGVLELASHRMQMSQRLTPLSSSSACSLQIQYRYLLILCILLYHLQATHCALSMLHYSCGLAE